MQYMSAFLVTYYNAEKLSTKQNAYDLNQMHFRNRVLLMSHL
jgi:hypothetical protein